MTKKIDFKKHLTVEVSTRKAIENTFHGKNCRCGKPAERLRNEIHNHVANITYYCWPCFATKESDYGHEIGSRGFNHE